MQQDAEEDASAALARWPDGQMFFRRTGARAAAAAGT